MKTISSHILKLTGKAELPSKIEIGYNYNISLSGSITTQTDSDNEDGTLIRLYSFKPIKVEVLTPAGETIKARDTRSNSQLIRALVYKRWVNAASSLSFEEFYDRVCREIMLDIDLLSNRAEKRV